MMPNDLNAIAGLDCVIAVVKIESMTFPRLDQFNILKFAIVISGDEQKLRDARASAQPARKVCRLPRYRARDRPEQLAASACNHAVVPRDVVRLFAFPRGEKDFRRHADSARSRNVNLPRPANAGVCEKERDARRVERFLLL